MSAEWEFPLAAETIGSVEGSFLQIVVDSSIQEDTLESLVVASSMAVLDFVLAF